MIIGNKFSGYSADGRRLYYKGGSSNNSYYANLDALYAKQAAQADQLMGIANSQVYPAYAEMGNEARGYASQGNRERAAATSAADFAGARDSGNQALMDSMASMGLNPGDATFQRNLMKGNIAGAASDAAGRTGARDRVDQQGFARLQDFTSMGMGLPGNATAAANSAANSASTASSMRQQQSAADANAVGGAVRGGMDLYGFMKAADGGLIRHFEGGGYVQPLAKGGIVGAMSNIAPPPPPPGVPQQSSVGSQVAGAVGPGLMKYGPQIGSGIQSVGRVVGSADMVGMGNAMAIPKGADPSVAQFFTSPDTIGYQMGADSTAMATQQVNAALGGIETAGTAAAGIETGAAAATAASEAAATTALAAEAGGVAAGGLGAAGAAIGTAMPWIGGAMLVGSALGLFKDGGHVGGDAIHPGASNTQGGPIAGPGGPKDDLVPAEIAEGSFILPVGTVMKYGLARVEKMNDVPESRGNKHTMTKVRLSDKEFALRPEAVQKIGLARLEKMRQEGLDFEKQLGIGK